MKTRVEAFRDWLKQDRVGKIYIYYTGHLAVDRGTIIDTGLAEEPLFIANGDIDELGKLAIDAFNSDRVHLFQRKIHDNEWQYIAMKRRDGERLW